MPAPQPWPLPAGHKFGASYGNIMLHDGRDSIRDRQSLLYWQATYCGRWRRPNNRPSGLFDGRTQQAVVEVQRTAGLPVTGLLGPDEWHAVWDHLPPPPREPTHAERVKEAMRRWDLHARSGLRYGSDPEAPPWYPGRPFGRRDKGRHVERVQSMLGHKVTGIFTESLERRVRGWQKTRGLPVSGIIDATQARMLEDEFSG